MSDFTCSEVNCGVWAGPLRAPRNSAADQKGSIHDDDVARKLGFRGGTVAGSLHMEQFPPLLERLLGRAWWETGGLSLYFRFATTDLESVKCFAVAPASNLTNNATIHATAKRRIEVWMDREDGERIADGSACVGGPDANSALRQRIAVAPGPTELRILADLSVGQTCADVPVRIGHDALAERCQVITEPSVYYTAASPWGRPALPPSLAVRAMRSVEPGLLVRSSPVVGLFGAIEVQHLAGPLFVETDYHTRGRVLAIADTPKTEYFWYESVLSDPATGRDCASMLMMLRFMKASSALWR
ncbi:MAG: hypothetical protein HC809_02485 [Gammaproteobacteria bacterium]|nr:hypothetical protein [Gammaproteobacteria bacterium]